GAQLERLVSFEPKNASRFGLKVRQRPEIRAGRPARRYCDAAGIPRSIERGSVHRRRETNDERYDLPLFVQYRNRVRVGSAMRKTAGRIRARFFVPGY